MPVEIVELSTRDPEVAHQTLNELYAPARQIAYARPPERFEFRLVAMQAGELHSDRFRHTMATRAQVAPFTHFVAATLLAGGIQWACDGRDLAFAPGDVIRYPTAAGSEVSWPEYELAVVHLPLATVAQVAETRAGAGPLRFDGMVPVSPALGRQWQRLSRYVHQSMAGPGSLAGHPLVNAQLVQLVAATALTVFPNTTMTAPYVPGPGWVGPAPLRRAVAYVDAHAGQPITVTDMAGAAGVTARALQLGFQRHYGTTPNRYLRRVRLEGAHRDLQAADPASGATVATIAARWGFGPEARFASFYHQRFGQRPSQTLRG